METMGAYMPDRYVQIDVKKVLNGHTVVCGMYTGARYVTFVMTAVDYQGLLDDGFFIRDGKEPDSAGVLNTTNVFVPEK